MKKKGEKSEDGARNINDVLCYELLVKIFMVLNVAELATVSWVCKSWEKACHDPTLWNKFDLRALWPSPFNIPKILRYDWTDLNSIGRMNQFLKTTLSLSDGNISCLVFNFYAFLTDEHLISAAQRTPNLERLILPAKGKLSKAGVDLAMSSWTKLRSMTLTSIIENVDIFSAIGKHCKGITHLKFTYNCSFQMKHVDALIKHTPNIEYLSVQSLKVEKKALFSALEQLEKLEVLNICHNLIIWNNDDEEGAYWLCESPCFVKHMLPIEYKRKVVYCEGNNMCVVCKNKDRDGRERKEPWEWHEDVWRMDEIQALSH